MSTVNNNILYNMYGQGSINNTDNHSTFISLDNDFIIKCYREPMNPSWITDKYAGKNFKCHLIFCNNLNIELLHIICFECDIYNILYNFNAFYPDGVYSIPLCSGLHSTSSYDNEYSCMLDFDYKEYNQAISEQENTDLAIHENFYLFVQEFSMIHSQVINKFKIRFNEDKLIDFTDLLFFVFLIDIIDLPEYKTYYDSIYEYM